MHFYTDVRRAMGVRRQLPDKNRGRGARPLTDTEWLTHGEKVSVDRDRQYNLQRELVHGGNLRVGGGAWVGCGVGFK